MRRCTCLDTADKREAAVSPQGCQDRRRRFDRSCAFELHQLNDNVSLCAYFCSNLDSPSSRTSLQLAPGDTPHILRKWNIAHLRGTGCSGLPRFPIPLRSRAGFSDQRSGRNGRGEVIVAHSRQSPARTAARACVQAH